MAAARLRFFSHRPFLQNPSSLLSFPCPCSCAAVFFDSVAVYPSRARRALETPKNSRDTGPGTEVHFWFFFFSPAIFFLVCIGTLLSLFHKVLTPPSTDLICFVLPSYGSSIFFFSQSRRFRIRPHTPSCYSSSSSSRGIHAVGWRPPACPFYVILHLHPCRTLHTAFFLRLPINLLFL